MTMTGASTPARIRAAVEPRKIRRGAANRHEPTTKTSEDPVAGIADDNQIGVLLLGEVDQRLSERFPNEHSGIGADTRRRQRVDGPRDPLLTAFDEQMLVFCAPGVAVRKFLAYDQHDVNVGIERSSQARRPGRPRRRPWVSLGIRRSDALVAWPFQ
jgi:hypothetical protein